MTIQKSELKMLLAESFGRKMEKAQEKAEHSIYESKGIAVGLLRAEVLLNQKTQEVKDKLLHGTVKVDLTDPIELAKFVVGEMMLVASELHKRGDEASKAGLQAEGEKKAWGEAAKILFDAYKEEKNKIEAVKEAIASGRLSQDGDDLVLNEEPGDNGQAGPRPPRAPGAHPGLPLKALREAAELKAAEEVAEKAAGAEQPAAEAPTVNPGPPKAPKKKAPKKKAPKKVAKQGENGAQDS